MNFQRKTKKKKIHKARTRQSPYPAMPTATTKATRLIRKVKTNLKFF
jgi:ribosome-associated translation inhibitor RaiA